MAEVPNLDYQFQYDDDLPILPVLIRARNADVAFSAMIDTGAEISILDSQIADQLGLDLNALRQARVSGVGGGVWDVWLSEVTLELLLEPDLALTLEVAFAPGLSDSLPNLLGRDVLEWFDLGLVHSERTLYLGRTESQP